MDITTTREWQSAAKLAREEREEQRRLILRYPDIAARLCAPPLDYKRPDQWTGYIPPRWDAPNEAFVVRPNDSPRRVALLELLEAAAERYDTEHKAAQPVETPAHEPAGSNT